MLTLLHVTGEGQEPLHAFSGHLVRNLEWHRYTSEAVDVAVDAVVASPASPSDAVDLVADLRGAGKLQRIFLIADRSPGWSSVEQAFDGVHVVADLAGLEEALGADVEPGAEARAVDPTDHDDTDPRRHVPRGGSRGMLRERLGDGTVSIRQTMREFDRRMEQDGLREIVVPVVSESQRPESEDVVGRSGVLSSAEAAAPSRPSPPAPRAQPGTRRGRRDTADPELLVPQLLALADRLYGVRETGTAVAAHVKELVGVDAVAVLVPDGNVWTVVAALGHRHLEERLTLAEDHWLVHEVALVHHGVIVEDTDIVRSRLSGAPLAAWPHLMACPLTEVRGAVVLARSDNGPAFTSRDLAHASEALHEAGSLFASAVQVRELARSLRRLAELDDPGFD